MKKTYPIILIIAFIIIFPMSGFPKDKKTPESFTNSIGQKFVYLKPGSFMMGSNSCGSDEKPVHKVTLTGFYMEKTEVTQGQWYDVMGTRPWSGKKHVQENRNNPAVYVSWNDAKKFIRKLNKKEGKQYRLPTEAEWEYACRAGRSSKYSFGDSESRLENYAWFRENALSVEEYYAHEVATKKPNPWGLYDMHGNVWEWCEDWYGKYSSGSMTNPIGLSSGSDRVIRGGEWRLNTSSCRSANRDRDLPDARNGSIGFRLVLLPGQ